MGLDNREYIAKEIFKIKDNFKNCSYDMKINIQEYNPKRSDFQILVRVTNFKMISGKLVTSNDILSYNNGVYCYLENIVKEQIRKLENSIR